MLGLKFLHLLAIFSIEFCKLCITVKELTRGTVNKGNACQYASWGTINNAYQYASWQVGTHVSGLTEHELTWPPQLPRRHSVPSGASSLHDLLGGGGCLSELLPSTSEFGLNKPSGCIVESTWRQACLQFAFPRRVRVCLPYHRQNKSWG